MAPTREQRAVGCLTSRARRHNPRRPPPCPLPFHPLSPLLSFSHSPQTHTHPPFPSPAQKTYASVAEAATDTPQLSTLLAAVKKANLTEKLSKGNKSITVFAPSNAAFEKMLKEKNMTADQLLAWDGLRSLLKAHIVKGAVKAADIKNGTVVKTWLPDANVTLVTDGGGVTAVGARSSGKVTTADIPAGSAIIHIVDGVIKPSKEAIKAGPAKEAAWKAAWKAKSPAAAPGLSKSRRLAERW